MSDKQKSSISEAAIVELAKQIFVEQLGRSPISDTQLTINSIRAATAFLSGVQAMQNGEIDLFGDETSPLDDAFAPNLKKTHPINLMSRAQGNLSEIQKVLAELDANPSAEHYEPYGWGKPEVNQARALFPAVINRVKQIANTKVRSA